MLTPQISEVTDLLQDYNTVPVFYELLADSCTPIHIFKALEHASPNCFILESVDNTQWGRYSFIGVSPKAQIKVKNHRITCERGGKTTVLEHADPLAYLKKVMSENRSPSVPNRPKMTGGLVGYFGYDMVRYMEKRLHHPPKDDLNIPDCHLFFFDEIVAFDHLSNKTVIIQNIRRGEDVKKRFEECEQRARQLADQILSYTAPVREPASSAPINVTVNISKEEYLKNVETAKEYIKNGDIFQVVLSRRLQVENAPDPFDVYRCLRSANPSPYLYYFKLEDYQIVGASPEMLVNVTKGVVTTKPIAGTSRRGVTEAEDVELEKALLNDPKEKAEHTMLVDLGRNDVGKVSRFGTVEVTRFMQVERYSQVMHIVSDVKGILREDKTALDALASVLPAGTLSGAPKVRAMEIIDELEPTARGLYGGTVGYLGFDGNIDTCIAIRTVLFKDKKAYVQAGGGIVADSVPENEYQESENKARAVMRAIEEASRMEHSMRTERRFSE